MERLTTKWNDGSYDTFDPIDIVDNEYSKANYERVLAKLGEYEDLEEQGLLLKLHFGIGDVVYEVVEGADENYSVIARKCRTYALLCALNEKVGKTIFLTKEEAEEALRKKVE